MKRVKISDLKAHLSQYLQEVRDGETIVVCDRERPVAQLGPLENAEPILVIRGSQDPEGMRKLLEERPPPMLGFDVVDMLREDRDAR